MQTKDNANFFIVATKGWVEKDGLFLLARRGPEELHMPGVWSLPGGKVETEIEPHILEKTLIKEIQEEVGVTVSDQMNLLYNNSFERTDGAIVVGLTFLCNYVSGEATPLEDTSEVAWYSLEQLKELRDIEEFLIKEIKILAAYKAQD